MKTVYLSTRILRLLLDDPAAPRYGVQMMAELGTHSGTLYPVLRRMEDEGLVTSEWEQIDPHEQERPPRRYYRLTPAGVKYARVELAALAEELRPPRE